MSKHTSIIILAAGNSSRLGRPKQLIEVETGTLLTKIIAEAQKSQAKDVHVVLGYLADHLRKIIPKSVNIIENKFWDRGMGSSIKKGVKECIKFSNPNNIIVSVADQPLLSYTVFDQLIQHAKSGSIVASRYNKTNYGPPVLFNQSHIREILEIEDQVGAKKVINQHLDEISFIPFAGGELDIDTETDLSKFRDNFPE